MNESNINDSLIYLLGKLNADDLTKAEEIKLYKLIADLFDLDTLQTATVLLNHI